MWWTLQVWAGVTVEGGCVDGPQLEDELALLMGDAAMADLRVRVRVEPNHGTLAAALVVEQRGEQLWSRILELQVADCPDAAEAAALSIHQGLAALPGWGSEGGQLPRVRGGMDLTATSSEQLDGRFALGGGIGVRLFGPVWIWSRLRFQTSLAITVGTGRGTLIGAGGAVGMAGVVPLRKHGLELGLGVAGGPIWAVGQGFGINETVLLSQATAEATVSWLSPGPLRIGLAGEVPLIRLVLFEAGGDSWIEPLFRAGLSVGLRF